MNNKFRHFSPNKITIKNTRNEFTNSPLKNRKRRKSSIPLQLRELIKNNCFNQISTEGSTKNSKKGELSGKKRYVKDIINTSIPEESENSSNNKEDKKANAKMEQNNKDNKNEIGNKNYYIHYIKNIYEKESHLNKENILKSEKKKANHYEKFIEGKRHFKPIYKRRNSELNNLNLKSNFHNFNFNMDKEPLRSSIKSSTIIDKKKSSEMEELIHKKNIKEKNKSKKKKKEKHKNKNKENHNNKEVKNNPINNFNCDSPKKSSGSINKQKKVKEKELLENEKKTENENNNENKNVKNQKMNKLKKLFCCLINKCESSIENEQIN